MNQFSKKITETVVVRLDFEPNPVLFEKSSNNSLMTE